MVRDKSLLQRTAFLGGMLRVTKEKIRAVGFQRLVRVSLFGMLSFSSVNSHVSYSGEKKWKKPLVLELQSW